MKKTIISAIALVASLMATAAVQYTHSVIVTKKSGETVEHKFAVTPSATIEGADIVFNTDGAKVAYPMSDVEHLTFGKTEVSGIDNVAAPENSVAFALGGGRLECSGMSAGTRLDVFTIDGRMAVSSVASAAGEASVDISQLPSGVYIASGAGKSFKFIK